MLNAQNQLIMIFTGVLIKALFYRILFPTLTRTTRLTSPPCQAPARASTAASTGDLLSDDGEFSNFLSKGWATKLCPGCGKTGSICWQLAGWFNNSLKFWGILKCDTKFLRFQIHLHLRPEIRGEPRPAQRGLGISAQVGGEHREERALRRILWAAPYTQSNHFKLVLFTLYTLYYTNAIETDWTHIQKWFHDQFCWVKGWQ